MSESSSRFDPRAEQLFREFRGRSDAGEVPDFEALCRAHPQHADALRKLLDEVDLNIGLGDELKTDSSTSSKLLQSLQGKGPRGTRYVLLGEVARGGMGAILKIWDDQLRRTLAMKVVLGQGGNSTGATPDVDPKMLGRFLEEAQITGQLDHPGIVPVHELGLDANGRVYFTMKLVKGEDLRAVFEKVKSGAEGWSQVRALGVLLRVCEAMSFAHSKSVVHRDLKPANVMVGKFGEVYVMDWGLARVLGCEDRHDLRLRVHDASTGSIVKTERHDKRESTLDSPLVTMDGDVVGTPSFMPLEQARGELDRLGPHSDVYSIGAMLYQLATDRMPYVPPDTPMSAHTILAALLHGPPDPVEVLAPATPPELVAIVEKAMARDIAQRYRDTTELASDLRAYVEGRVVAAYETGTWAESKKWVKRNRPLAASLAAAVLAIVAGAASFAWKAKEAATARDDLATKNTQLESSNVALDRARRDALASAETATRLKNEAETKTREARWNGYVAAISGASAAMSAGESASVRRLLDEAPQELRNWEWRYLDARSDTSILKLEHRGTLTSASFSPDGTRIVTASADNTARVWNAQSGEAIASLENHGESLASASFSPDGARIVTMSAGETARVWDAQSGNEITTLKEPSEVMFASFSPDGTRVVTATFGTARVWDARSGRPIATLGVHQVDGSLARVNTASFSPDGTRVVTASFDKTARVWDAQSGSELVKLVGHTKNVRTASFSPDGTCIVTGSDDKTARVWSAESGQAIAKLEGHTNELWSASFSPDGTRIVTSSMDSTARVWDARSGQELAKLDGHASSVWSASFSPDGMRIVTASSDGTARVWDAQSGQELAKLQGHTAGVSHASFSRDGTRIVTAALGDDTARVWDARPVQKSALLERPTIYANSLSFSRDGAHIVTASGDNTAYVRDAISGNVLARLEGHTDGVRSVSFNRDGTRIVTASNDGTMRVWDAQSGENVATLDGHASRGVSAWFSSDGTRIVTGSDDKTARVWDVGSGQEIAKLDGRGNEVRSATFSPDGTRIVTAARIPRVWDARSGHELAKLEGHTAPAGSASFSSDGTRIVTASYDRTARIWDAQSGVELAKLEGHTSGVRSASFSPDGTRIVTAGQDKTARVWDAQSGRELAKLEGFVLPVLWASFSPDGTRVVTMSTDGIVRVWDSVPYQVRYRDGQALLAAQPAAERALDAALAGGHDFVAAGAKLRQDASLDPLVKRAALDALLVRAQTERDRAKAAAAPASGGK